MKKLVVTLLVLALALTSFAGCADKPVDEKKETLYMYTEAGFAPFEYYDEDGNVAGVDIDIAKAIAEKLNVNIEINDVGFSAVLETVSQKDDAVGIAGLTVDAERQKTLDFTTTYCTSTQSVIFKKGTIAKNADGKIDPSVLAGKKVGVQTGTSGDFFVQDIKGAEVKGYKNALWAKKDIGKGCDVVVIDNLVGKNITSNDADLECVDLVAEPEHFAIAVKKGNTELLQKLDAALKELIADGSIDEFMLKHSKG